MRCISSCQNDFVKQEASFFEDKSPVLVYIAKRLSDAMKLEELLTEAGLDFGVEADEYRGGVIFRTVRTGAFFYVLQESVEAAFAAMERGGYKPHVEEPEQA
jgi:hypothetical protein